MILSSIIRSARNFATEAHRGQIRRDKSRSPFIGHLVEVALLVELSGGTEIEIAAAWLHDTVEDTPVLLDGIRIIFGEHMANIIDGLTDPEEFRDMTTEERKKKQAERVVHKSKSVKRIKLADQISNVRSIVLDPPLSWERKKCLDYILGAKLVVKECRGVSDFLDGQFSKVFIVAKKVYHIE